MKRRNTITAVLLLAFLAFGAWQLGSASLEEEGALRKEFVSVRQGTVSVADFIGGGAETAVNKDLDADHHFIQLFGGFQRFTGRRLVEDSAGSHVVKLDNGALNFANLGAVVPDCSHNGEKTAAFQQELDAMGIPSLYVVAPQKTGRDMDLLPPGINSFGNEEADSLLAVLAAAGTDYLDLRPVFEETGCYEDWFFRTDHHWKPEAGFFTWQVLNQTLREDYGLNIPGGLDGPEQWDTELLEDFFLGSQGKRVGTLYAGTDDITLFSPKFETNLTYSCPSYPFTRTGSFDQSVCFPERVAGKDYFNGNPYTYYAGGDYPLATITNHNNPDGPKVLLLRESFACAVTPFLSLSCSELTTVDLRYFKRTLMDTISQVQPDLVLILYNSSSSGVSDLFSFSAS